MNRLLNVRKTQFGILFLIMMLILASCGSASDNLVEDKVNVVASFYPLYDFAQKIGGEHVHVINLVPAGVEPHDWTPKAKDMVNTNKAQVFLYNGAGFEGWIENFLESMNNENLIVKEASKGVNLIKGNSDHEPANEEHGDHGHEAHEHEAEEHELDEDHNHSHGEYDPHTWVSPKSAIKMAHSIYDALVEADAEHQEDYEKGLNALVDSLEQLDQEYTESLATTSKKEIVVSHRSFGYLCKDYGLTQMALMGLSPDAEPTSKDIADIVHFVEDHEIRYIFFEELVSDKLANTLAKETGTKTLVLNPLEGLTEEQLEAGEDYISIMRTNLQNLLLALE